MVHPDVAEVLLTGLSFQAHALMDAGVSPGTKIP